MTGATRCTRWWTRRPASTSDQEQLSRQLRAALGDLISPAFADLELVSNKSVQQAAFIFANPKLHTALHLDPKRFKPHRLRIIVGGNRSSKSWTAVIDMVLSCLLHGGDYWICCRDTAAANDVIVPYLARFFGPERFWPNYNRTEKSFRYKHEPLGTECSLRIKTYESDPSAFTGAQLDGIWLDEEPPRDIWKECRVRIADRRGFMTSTFTPIEAFRTGEGWFHDELISNPIIPDRQVWNFHTADNPWFPREELENWEREYDKDELQVRLYGAALFRAFSPVFDIDRLGRFKTRLAAHPPKTVPIEGWLTVTAGRAPGAVTLWERPMRGVDYVVGADVAEGLIGGDYDDAVVTRMAEDGRTYEVAAVHGHMPPQDFADIIAQLALYYGDTTACVERNNMGLAVINRLTDLRIPQFVRQKDDAVDPGLQEVKFGVFTTRTNKASHVNMLGELIHLDMWEFRSPEAIDECMRYVWDGKGGMGGAKGAHDDRVMSRVMAAVGMGRTSMRPGPIVSVTGDSVRAPRVPGWKRLLDPNYEPELTDQPWTAY